ncbi:nucleotide-diphospho-sugar transferase [Blakeslea trispora]|nr:nucleotide-diphospho-sugar transferase [Blakeslea trispora]
MTIPLNIPWFTSIHNYPNSWQYTPSDHFSSPNPNFNAAFITFVKQDKSSLSDLRKTIRQIEDIFNKHYGYPYIVISDSKLTTEYMELASSLTKSDMVFETVSSFEYGYAKKIDQYKASLARKYLKDARDDTEELAFKARLMAGTIFSRSSLRKLDYFWRFEPGTEYLCPIEFDPFEFMYKNKKELSFSIATYHRLETIPTLFESVKKFRKQNPQFQYASTDNHSILSAMLDENGNYNQCHFWNSFQIASTKFFTSEKYTSYFNFIDKEGGIFYERWSDPVIQSLAAALFLERDQIHFWEDIGYTHSFFYTHCPNNKAIWKKCSCRPPHSFDHNSISCLSKFQYN